MYIVIRQWTGSHPQRTSVQARSHLRTHQRPSVTLPPGPLQGVLEGVLEGVLGAMVAGSRVGVVEVSVVRKVVVWGRGESPRPALTMTTTSTVPLLAPNLHHYRRQILTYLNR